MKAAQNILVGVRMDEELVSKTSDGETFRGSIPLPTARGFST